MRGIVIEGPSGSGKSRLALSLMARGAALVADDRSLLFAARDGVYARAPRSIAGLVEVRGAGILRLSARRLARIAVIVTLDPGRPAARLPDQQTCIRLGHRLSCLPGPASCADHGSFAQALHHLLEVPGQHHGRAS